MLVRHLRETLVKVVEHLLDRSLLRDELLLLLLGL